MVNSWINADFGESEKQILGQIPLISSKKKLKPFYFYKQFRNKSLNKHDTVVDMVCTCVNREIKEYNKIKKKINLLRIDFDNFSTKTDFYISKLCTFIGAKKTKFTKKIMRRERLPRQLNIQDRLKKIKKIKRLVSDKHFKRLIELEKLYINHKDKNKW